MKYIPKILIIEDSSAVRSAIIRSFRVVQIDFIEIDNGDDAMDFFDQSDSPQVESLDLIITDIQIPGANGLEVLREKNALKNYMPYIPVLIITGLLNNEIFAETCKQNIVDVLLKPFTAKDLRGKCFSIINALLNTDIDSSKNSMVICNSNFQREYFSKMLVKLGSKKVDLFDQINSGWENILFSLENPYDLVICDWQLGTGTCIDLISKLRRRSDFTNIPVCVMMSSFDQQKLNQLMSFPLVSVIYKNLDKDDLAFKIKYLFYLKDWYTKNAFS
ncbi:MAG: response regulator [Oligoflexia bacterium]|nr:response regulator [Oligoflexia bacterium]